MYKEIGSSNIYEARDLADHMFEVESHRLTSERGHLIPDKKSIFRSDNQLYLGTVGIGWEPVQPIVLYEMAEKVLESVESGYIEKAFSIKGCSVIGISLKLATREFVNDDPVDISLLMVNSFDGTHSISGYTTAYHRNSESYINTSSRVFNLRHTKFVVNRIDVVKAMLEYYYKEIDLFSQKIQSIVDKPMSEQMAMDWFRSLFPPTRTRHAEKILEGQLSTFACILMSQNIKRTCYSAFCSLIDYSNNYRRIAVHNNRNEDEVRFESIHFGTANKFMQKGLDKLLPTDFTGFSASEFNLE